MARDFGYSETENVPFRPVGAFNIIIRRRETYIIIVVPEVVDDIRGEQRSGKHCRRSQSGRFQEQFHCDMRRMYISHCCVRVTVCI